MDKRWLKTSLTVSVIVVMVLLLYLVNYLFYDDDSVEKNNQDKKIVENTIKLDSNSDEAKLNRYVIAFNSIIESQGKILIVVNNPKFSLMKVINHLEK